MAQNNYDSVPAELKALPNWVGFRVWWDEKEKKYKKMPIDIRATVAAKMADPTVWKDVPAESNNPKTWCDFTTAADWLNAKKPHKKNKWHIGFAFDGSGVCGIDLDHCISADGGISEFAKGILAEVPSYTEYSPSGTGLHIFAKCGKAFSGGGINREEIEVYQSGRFFTVTGNRYENSPETIIDCTEAVLCVYNRFNSTPNGTVCVVSGVGDTVDEIGDGKTTAAVGAHKATRDAEDLSDAELLDKARNSKNGTKFDALWRGDFSGYKSQSEADMALCLSLAFWTGDDANRIDELFRQSGLMRPKWDERHGNMTYGQKTVAEALSKSHEIYKSPQPKADKPKRKRTSLGEATIAEIENAYHLVQTDGKSKRLTNFVIKPEKKLDTEDETIYSVTLVGSGGRTAAMQFKTADLVNSQSFKRKLNERDIGWSFLAGDREIELIKEHLKTKPCPQVIGFKGIGLVKLPSAEDAASRWVYCGERATIDENGNAASEAQSVPCENPIRSDIENSDEISRFELEQAGHALLEYNELPKTVSVLCFIAAALAKPKLTERGIKFPHLVIVGECGSGKSFTTEKVIQPFFGLKSFVGASKITGYSFLASAGASNNIPLLIDEYKPSTMRETVVDNIHNGLRDLYDGHEGERGRADMTVKKYKLTTPLVLVGEESPSEPALKERSIELLFSKQDIADRQGAGERVERPQMQESIRQLGKAVLLTVLKENPSNLRNAYDDFKREVDEKLPPRIRNNIAAICVGAYLLERTAKRYGADFKAAFGIEQSAVLPAITEAVKRYTLGGGDYNKSVVDQAFEVFDRMTEVLKSDVHYKRADGGSVPAIAFDIKRIYDKFTKYRRDCNQKGEVLDFNMFRSQLEKKDYFIKRNYAVQLREDADFGEGKWHAVKCYLLNAQKLAACADISNILERLRLTVAEQPTYTQARLNEALPFDGEAS
jgi:primase-polymerase (primpol)-like protein